MSRHVEWFSTDHPFFVIEVVDQGTTVPEEIGISVDEEAAIVIYNDEITVLEGSKEQLITALEYCLNKLKS